MVIALVVVVVVATKVTRGTVRMIGNTLNSLCSVFVGLFLLVGASLTIVAVAAAAVLAR